MLCKAAQPSFIQPLAPCSSKVRFLLVPACDKSSTVGGGALTPPSGIQGRETQSLLLVGPEAAKSLAGEGG